MNFAEAWMQANTRIMLVTLFVKYISDKSRNDSNFMIAIPAGCHFEDFVALKGHANIGEEMNKKMAALSEAHQLDGVFITDLEARRDKYKLIKSGMMQKLLTGQIRLIYE